MGILKTLVITVAGDVGHKPEQLKRWVEANDGRWAPRIAKDVTHLICSKDQWKKGSETVQLARRFGTRVVTYDWLEDSLQKKRRLSEKKYLWGNVSAQNKKWKQMKRLGKLSDTNKFYEGIKKSREELGSGTSIRSVPSNPHPRSGFFVSSLAELKERREKRAHQEEQAAANSEQQVMIGEDIGCADQDKQISRSESALPSQPPSASQRPEDMLPSPPATVKSSPNSSQESVSDNSTASSSTITAPTNALAPNSVPTSNDRVGANPISLKDNFHIYTDETCFPYDVLLLRPNLFRNLNAHYTLRLFESNMKPHTYCTVVRYRPATSDAWPTEKNLTNTPGIPGIRYPLPSSLSPQSEPSPAQGLHPNLQAAIQAMRPAQALPGQMWKKALCPLNTDFSEAFRLFRHVFLTLTTLCWEERANVDAEDLQHQRAKVLNIEPFFYQIPRPPAPIGMLIEEKRKVAVQYVPAGAEVAGGLDLPGMDVQLNREGKVGRKIMQEVEAKKRQEEAAAEEEEKKRKEKLKLKVGTKKRNSRAPLFSGEPARSSAPQKSAGMYNGRARKDYFKSPFFDYDC